MITILPGNIRTLHARELRWRASANEVLICETNDGYQATTWDGRDAWPLAEERTAEQAARADATAALEEVRAVRPAWTGKLAVGDRILAAVKLEPLVLVPATVRWTMASARGDRVGFVAASAVSVYRGNDTLALDGVTRIWCASHSRFSATPGEVADAIAIQERIYPGA